MATVKELLHPQTIVNVISRIREPYNRLQRHFGMGVGGANVKKVKGKSFSWDIFDNVRDIATVRGHGAPAASIASNPIGRQDGRMLRTNERLRLEYEELHVLRRLGSNNWDIDDLGRDYITRQEMVMGQRLANLREFVVSRLLRGGFYVHVSGDDWKVSDSDTGALFHVNYQVPANHIGATIGPDSYVIDPWTAAATGEPITDLLAINAISEGESGMALMDVFCNSTTFLSVLRTDEVQNLAGAVNRPFEVFEYNPTEGKSPADGKQTVEYYSVLNGLPMFRWFVIDTVLKDPLTGALTKLFPDNRIAVLPSVDRLWVEMLEGSEIVDEGYGRNVGEVFGTHFHYKGIDDPAGIELYQLCNLMPALYIPKAIFWLTVG